METKKMKINKETLKEAIHEALKELNVPPPPDPETSAPVVKKTASAMDLRKQARSTDAAKEIGNLTPRERKALGDLQKIQTDLSQPGEQASSTLLKYINLAVAEATKGVKQ
jgi:hypothetical protein